MIANRIEWIDRRIEKVTESGCWVWVGAVDGEGYGEFEENGKKIKTHRYMYEVHVGAIAKGLTLDHLCRVRRCANPYHLEPVRDRTNTLRGVGPSAINSRKTHCIRGHEFNKANTIWSKHHRSGALTRRCRACNKMHCSNYDKRRKVA